MSRETKDSAIARMIARDHLADANAFSVSVCPKHSFYERHGKRVVDIMIAIPAILVTLPINLVLALCTYFDVGSPIIFKQKRVGKGGKVFTIYKFRNMTNEKDADGNLLPAQERVTRLGKFVRKCSLDELLNFYSVLKGDLSIIGPRPLPVEFMDRYTERHKMRHAVKPGLECPRFITEGKYPYQRQFESDVWYVEHVSFLVDCKLVLMLFKMVFNMSRRSKNASGAGVFMGYDEEGQAFGYGKVPKKYFEEYELLCRSKESSDIGFAHDDKLVTTNWQRCIFGQSETL